MKKFIAVLMVVALFTSGCTGSFALTKKVYNFHREQQSKWMDELVFLGAVILPVYGLAAWGDAIIFNTIEFWSDDNPIARGNGRREKIIAREGEIQAVITCALDDGSVKIDSKDNSLVFERSTFGVVAKDSAGNVLYSSRKDVNGNISVYDSSDRLVRSFSNKRAEAAKEHLLQ
ncbi:MAG: DUF3332 family protein [Candidatus Omnitrophica bacterium]|nr:DUF3332 family protein [Candidatus Omnitrophota bacterium]